MEKKVQIPAIGLIVLGILGVLVSALGFLQSSFDAQKLIDMGMSPDRAQRIAEFMGSGGHTLLIAAHVVGILGCGFTAWAGFQMLKLESWRACVVANVLVMVPFTSCCCLLGVPVGIWGLVLLFNADVKRAFEGGGGPSPDFTT